MMTNSLFNPGTLVTLELPRDKNLKLKTSFLGYKEEEYIFLDFPSSKTGYLPIEDDAPCIIRFVTNGQVYGFQSFILKILKHPFPFLIIKYPQSLEHIELRTSYRYPVKLEISFSLDGSDGGEGNRLKGLIIDISEGGCLLQTKDHFRLGTILFLFINLPQIGTINDLEARVHRIDKKRDHYSLGLNFSNNQDPNREQVRKYIDQIDKLQIMV
jgi:c-di-GMP-binding flagellar brake protein YcgR